MHPLIPIIDALNSRDLEKLTASFVSEEASAEGLLAELDAFGLQCLGHTPQETWDAAVTEAQSACGPEFLELDVPLYDQARTVLGAPIRVKYGALDVFSWAGCILGIEYADSGARIGFVTLLASNHPLAQSLAKVD